MYNDTYLTYRTQFLKMLNILNILKCRRWILNVFLMKKTPQKLEWTWFFLSICEPFLCQIHEMVFVCSILTDLNGTHFFRSAFVTVPAILPQFCEEISHDSSYDNHHQNNCKDQGILPHSEFSVSRYVVIWACGCVAQSIHGRLATLSIKMSKYMHW